MAGLGILAFSFTLPLTRIVAPELGGTFVGLGRALVATLIAIVVLLARGERLPERKYWFPLLVTALGVVVGFPLLSSLAMQSVPSIHGVVIVGLLPAMTAALGVLRTRERTTPLFWIAVGIGIVGILVFPRSTRLRRRRTTLQRTRRLARDLLGARLLEPIPDRASAAELASPSRTRQPVRLVELRLRQCHQHVLCLLRLVSRHGPRRNRTLEPTAIDATDPFDHLGRTDPARSDSLANDFRCRHRARFDHAFKNGEAPMSPYFLALSLLISSVLAYQISQKLLPNLSPWHLLSAVYGLALIVCLGFALLEAKEKPLLEGLRGMTWPVLLLAASVVGIELAWILAVRAGGQISLTGLIANISVAMLAIPIGVYFFKEKLSTTNLIGAALCLIGLVLVSRK
jgi:drug/metabolite transporter (DMT)-like permease